MRRVLYVEASPASEAAARLLADRFDVALATPDALAAPAGPTVLLAAGGAAAEPVASPLVRIVGLVDEASGGPWPAHWYALVPANASRAVLARAVENALVDAEHAAEIARLDRELSELNAIGIRLSAERSPRDLLETILTKAREITKSDAGSLYLVEEEADGARRLRFVLAQNDSVEFAFRASTLPLTSESVAGHAALTGEILNLADAYAPPAGAPFHINRSFDEQGGYRTKSMLVVPMRTPQNETIGVLQLINCAPDDVGRLRAPADVERAVRPFDARAEKLAGSLASQAAVALANSRLFEAIRELFEGFVKASVTAIESRDPVTSGHSFRVETLTVGLASVVDHASTGPYAALRFSTDEMTELRYAALLHDFGKVGVREQVLVKSKKLLPGELEAIRHRVELVKRGLELRYAGKKIEYLLEKGRRRFQEQAAAYDVELAAYLAELDEHMALIAAANEPAVRGRDVAEEIARVARRRFESHRGERLGILTAAEASALSITRGSLTPKEIRQIQSHVEHTFEFLKKIPWTREFRRIPEIARAHHEKLDGSGYPTRAKAEDIPVQSRMMTIADIYDALTAGDRPYKHAVPVEAALDILDAERRAGRIDAALFELFLGAKVYERTAGLSSRRGAPRRPSR